MDSTTNWQRQVVHLRLVCTSGYMRTRSIRLSCVGCVGSLLRGSSHPTEEVGVYSRPKPTSMWFARKHPFPRVPVVDQIFESRMQ